VRIIGPVMDSEAVFLKYELASLTCISICLTPYLGSIMLNRMTCDTKSSARKFLADDAMQGD